LASTSPRRRELLDLIGIEHVIVPSNLVEAMNDDEPAGDLVRHLSLAKAMAVREQGTGDLVLAADTVVALDDRVIGKPSSAHEALSMLRLLRGRTHRVLTGVSLVEPGGEVTTSLEETLVTMRHASDSELWAYVQTGEPFDKAGAYGIQGQGVALVERLVGCYSNVVGLPLCLVCQLLARQSNPHRQVVWGDCRKSDRWCPLLPTSQYQGLPKADTSL